MKLSMAASSSLLLWVSLVRSVNANAFLQAQLPKDSGLVSKTDVEQSMLSEFRDLSRASEVSKIEVELSTMFAALPKTEHGKLEPSTVRYALHRYFVQKHGWYMRGLEPAGAAWNSSSPADILKDRAPAYIQSSLGKVHVQGLGLHELAVFAATLADLVLKEAAGSMQRIFAVLRLPTWHPVARKDVDGAIKAYLVTYLLGGNVSFSSPRDFKALQETLENAYPEWPETVLWTQDLRQAYDLLQQPRRNPFVMHQETLDEAIAFVRELGHRFGSFQNLECHALKRKLVDMEHQGTGRVQLSRFYAGGLDGDWTFTESVEYLRNLGVLDETDPRRPSVVIPNYMTSQTNCLTSSGFYAVCCLDECEGLLQHLEEELASPSAKPARIARLVAALPSDTVDAPRNLSTALHARLDEIAAHHGGRVPLYGRLFSQWMHHAYPRECPFPHVSGTTSPMSPVQWIDVYGIDTLEASWVEMERHQRTHQDEAAAEVQAIPWTAVEELVAGPTAGRKAGPWVSASRTIFALLALASLLAPLLRSVMVVMTPTPEGKIENLLV